MARADLRIEVVFSPAARLVWRWEGRLPEGARLADALRLSGWAQAHPGLEIDSCTVGVWGRSAALAQALRDGDRVEVYRPLLVDPKEARRLRYRQQRGLADAPPAAVKAGR